MAAQRWRIQSPGINSGNDVGYDREITKVMSLNSFLEEKLNRRKQEGSLRSLKKHEDLIDFSSNDYLGFAKSRELFEQIAQRVPKSKFLNGASGSRLISGNSAETERLEQRLAHFFKAPAALLFNSGYAANQSVLSSVPQKDDVIFYDELAHACIKDGARLSLAKHYSFHHNDLDDLAGKITRIKASRAFIAVESIYSMDGDTCPLVQLVDFANKLDAVIILDEAHSTGVVGDLGSGYAASLNLHDKIDIRIHTFGKAMGVHGACVVGSSALTEYLINFARPFIYTTALPPHSVQSIESSLDFIIKNSERIDQLHQNIKLYKEKIKRESTDSSIQTFIVGGNEPTIKASKKLFYEGFDVRPILAPTVPKGSERLRICLHSFNTSLEIERLCETLQRL